MEESDRRIYFMIDPTNVWDRAEVELAIPGYAVGRTFGPGVSNQMSRYKFNGNNIFTSYAFE